MTDAVLAYLVGAALRVPLADELGALDEALHATERAGPAGSDR